MPAGGARCVLVATLGEVATAENHVCFFETYTLVHAKLVLTSHTLDTAGITGILMCLKQVQEECAPVKVQFLVSFSASGAPRHAVMAHGTPLQVEQVLETVRWFESQGVPAFPMPTLEVMLCQHMTLFQRSRYDSWLNDPLIHHREIERGGTILPAVPKMSELSPAYTPRANQVHNHPASGYLIVNPTFENDQSSYDEHFDGTVGNHSSGGGAVRPFLMDWKSPRNSTDDSSFSDEVGSKRLRLSIDADENSFVSPASTQSSMGSLESQTSDVFEHEKPRLRHGGKRNSAPTRF